MTAGVVLLVPREQGCDLDGEQCGSRLGHRALPRAAPQDRDAAGLSDAPQLSVISSELTDLQSSGTAYSPYPHHRDKNMKEGECCFWRLQGLAVWSELRSTYTDDHRPCYRLQTAIRAGAHGSLTYPATRAGKTRDFGNRRAGNTLLFGSEDCSQ